MYCYKCGSPISDEALRQKIGCCSVCGAPIHPGENDNGYQQNYGGPYSPPYPPQPAPVQRMGTRQSAAEGKDRKTLIIVLSVIIGALLLMAVLLMVRVFTDNDRKSAEPGNRSASDNAAPTYTEPKTEEAAAAQPAAKYTPGSYKNVTQSTINLRAEPSTYSARLLMVGWGAVITVTEVYEDTTATDETVRWWGKTNVSGYTGWVALYYFSKVG